MVVAQIFVSPTLKVCDSLVHGEGGIKPGIGLVLTLLRKPVLNGDLILAALEPAERVKPIPFGL